MMVGEDNWSIRIINFEIVNTKKNAQSDYCYHCYLHGFIFVTHQAPFTFSFQLARLLNNMETLFETMARTTQCLKYLQTIELASKTEYKVNK